MLEKEIFLAQGQKFKLAAKGSGTALYHIISPDIRNYIFIILPFRLIFYLVFFPGLPNGFPQGYNYPEGFARAMTH
ncbi:MAG: hypothetical protein GY862_38150 [Gammaproteobacteria bacterium]|nr:hypothetical protein [Gammaproteobacteria bacterium]